MQVVAYVIERQMTGDETEPAISLRERRREVSDAVVDRARRRVPVRRLALSCHLDKPRGQVDAGHPCAPRREDPREIAFAAAGVQHVPAGELAEEREHPGGDRSPVRVLPLLFGDQLAIARRVLIPGIRVAIHSVVLPASWHVEREAPQGMVAW